MPFSPSELFTVIAGKHCTRVFSTSKPRLRPSLRMNDHVYGTVIKVDHLYVPAEHRKLYQNHEPGSTHLTHGHNRREALHALEAGHVHVSGRSKTRPAAEHCSDKACLETRLPADKPCADRLQAFFLRFAHLYNDTSEKNHRPDFMKHLSIRVSSIL